MNINEVCQEINTYNELEISYLTTMSNIISKVLNINVNVSQELKNYTIIYLKNIGYFLNKKNISNNHYIEINENNNIEINYYNIDITDFYNESFIKYDDFTSLISNYKYIDKIIKNVGRFTREQAKLK